MEEMRQPLEVVRDDQQSTEHESVFRANLADEDAVNEWMEAYSVRTNTSWIVWRVQSVGESLTPKNKKSGPRNAKCMAKVDVKIKLVSLTPNRGTSNLQREVPLSAVIRIDDRHSHSTDSADALRLLWGTRSTRQTFLRYFSEGMTPSEARRLHESKLSMEDDGPAKLANAALNPPQRTVYHWHSVWREACFGGTHIDPVLKLEEKASLYAAQGMSKFVGESVLYVKHYTPIQVLKPDSLRLKCTKTLLNAHTLSLRLTAGPEVMYADTAEKLEAATAEVKALQHDAFVSRVLTFLRRQEEWVQLYRLDVLTRGHNTNNFAEATIRVLKDIILNRVEAFNAVALVDSVALVWEKYFESRILRHAYSRVAAHQLLYKRLLSRMPKDAAEAIQVVGQGQYIVPSATHPSSSYEKKYGGLFPNAPALSTDDRYQLGQLALGEKCPPRIFFEPFQEEEPSSSSRTTAGTSAQQEEPDELQAMQGTSTQEATHLAPVPSVPDAAQLAQLVLKHRQGKNHKMRIVVFVGSPIETDSKELTKLAKRLKKEKVNVDIVNFGEDNINTEKLATFINTLNGKDGSGSHLVTVPPGHQTHLSDALISSPVIQGEDGTGGIGLGVGGFEFGVDPNEDPELALALRVSMEEQRQRQEDDARRAAANSAKEGTQAPSTAEAECTAAVFLAYFLVR
ncbi:hypothetical protein HPB51_000569 [Rhipicephalus microplus]|uniref:VWFA domain-containing protein n=1 Tax=Rhipicephalus microplus TaxID=6941 RepID=A0A9J6DXL9_RHIMP|nr:hypothetical protein HPB51_000569 [Rhipicephalus microplus]